MLDLKVSPCWLVFLVALHLLAGVGIVITSFGAVTKALLLCITVASLLYQWRMQQTPIQLVWRNGNRWFINEQSAPAKLVSVNFFSRWLVIISLLPQIDSNPGKTNQSKTNQGKTKQGINSIHTVIHLLKTLLNRTIHKRKFIIPFDALSEDTFRLLRVRLRIEGYESINPQEETIR